MVNIAVRNKYMLNMGHVAEFPDVLDELEDEHLLLAHEWRELVQAIKAIESENNFRKVIPLYLLKDLQQKAVDFLLTADKHIQKSERLLVPELDAYYPPEDTIPSIRFANLMMEEQYKGAKQLLCKFIQQVDMAIDPIPGKHVRYLMNKLENGLNMMANYLNVEQQYVLPPAERMTTELVSWYF